jgi:hypothetical protein
MKRSSQLLRRQTDAVLIQSQKKQIKKSFILPISNNYCSNGSIPEDIIVLPERNRVTYVKQGLAVKSLTEKEVE